MTHPKMVLYVSAATEIDEDLRQELERHVTLLEQQGVMQGWHAQRILAGSVLVEDQEEAFTQASLVLLLISADFFASSACQEQMRRALERERQREVQVLPILARPVDMTNASFLHLPMMPTNGKPVTMWSNRDAAWTHIAEEIRCLLEGKPLSPARQEAQRTEEISKPIEPQIIEMIHLREVVNIAAQRGWNAWAATYNDVSISSAYPNPSMGYAYVVTRTNKKEGGTFHVTSHPDLVHLCKLLVEVYGRQDAVDSSEWAVKEIFPFLY